VDRAEILAKLERMAQNGGSIAELNACKELLRQPEYAFDITADLERDDAAPADPFGAVDGGDELDRRRQRVA
jgi:hypothetical protein